MDLRGVARQLGQLLVDALGVLAQQQRKARRGGPAMLMRKVIEHGPENLRHVADAKAAGAEWGWGREYVYEAAKVAAWDPELAARVAAGEYWMEAAIEAERAHRLGPWHVRHPECPRPLPGPDDPLPDTPAPGPRKEN